MNQPSYDEYEEVESPFASKSSDKNPHRERLRTRKNVFNRPFATDSTHAPTYIETSATRRSISHGDDNTELIHRRSSALSETDIDYLEDEEEEEIEEVVEKLPVRKTSTSTKKNSKLKKNLLSKIGWAVIGLLVLRLIFMDRGVWDYFATEGAIQDKRDELSSIKKENGELKTEISRIQLDKNFQKQLAKEHLGVIAADEFLILFAGESSESSTESDRQL
ncbi:MAG: FtsB family cell division protein [Bacteriovoracia bacterium]